MAIGTIPPVFGDTPLTVANLAPGGLRQGQTIEARVLERVSEDVLRLATASGRLDLVLPKSGVPSLPQPGQIVHLAVGHSTSAGAPLLQFLDGPARGLTVTVRTPDLQRPGGPAPQRPERPRPRRRRSRPPPRCRSSRGCPLRRRSVAGGDGGARPPGRRRDALRRPDGPFGRPGRIPPAGGAHRGLRTARPGARSQPADGRRCPAGAPALRPFPGGPPGPRREERSGHEGRPRPASDRRPRLALPSSAAPEANTAETWLAGEAREGDPPKRPAPPHAGSQPEGQSAAHAMPAPTTADEARGLALRLLDEAEQVEARILLQQAASLAPEDGSGAPDPAAPQRYAFDIPLAGPTGPSIAEIRVESDDPRQRAETPDGGRTGASSSPSRSIRWAPSRSASAFCRASGSRSRCGAKGPRRCPSWRPERSI